MKEEQGVAIPRKARSFRFNPSERLISVISPIALLLIWEAAARSGWIDVRLFPAPSAIIAALLDLAKSGELLQHVEASMLRLLYGTIVGLIPALAIGIAMGLNRTVRAIVDPLVAATYPIPKSSILPLALLVFGLGEGSKIFMVAIGVFFPVLINTTTGVLEINKIYLEVGENFRASRWNVFRTIALPGALPTIMTGIRLGIGMGLVLIAVAEMVGAKSGLGYMIWNAWETFSVEKMYAGLFMIALIGIAITVFTNELERLLVPWRREER